MFKLEPLFTKQNFPDLWNRTPLKFYSKLLKETVSEFPTRNPQVLEILPKLNNKTFIAGSAALGLYLGMENVYSDIDIFSTDQSGLEAFMKSLLEMGYRLTEVRENSVNLANPKYSRNISLIKMTYFDTVEHCLDTFDFRVCQFAATGEEIIFNPDGLIDFLNKRLNVHVINVNQDAIYRLVKYVKKGYYPTDACLSAITQAVGKQAQQADQGRPNAFRRRTYPRGFRLEPLEQPQPAQPAPLPLRGGEGPDHSPYPNWCPEHVPVPTRSSYQNVTPPVTTTSLNITAENLRRLRDALQLNTPQVTTNILSTDNGDFPF